VSAPRPSASCALTLHLCKSCALRPFLYCSNHHPARSVWDEHPFLFTSPSAGSRSPTSPHLHRNNVANLCISSASIHLHERLRHSDQPSFFDASKLPFLKIIDDEVERHLRQTHGLFSIGLATISLHPGEPANALQYLRIQAPNFPPNAILNLSCRRIPLTQSIYLCSGAAITDVRLQDKDRYIRKR
jgi:hypothetical protein